MTCNVIDDLMTSPNFSTFNIFAFSAIIQIINYTTTRWYFGNYLFDVAADKSKKLERLTSIIFSHFYYIIIYNQVGKKWLPSSCFLHHELKSEDFFAFFFFFFEKLTCIF